MIGDLYQCVNNNEYGFKIGQNYRVDRISEVYLPQSESLEFIDVIVFEKDLWVPEYDFKRIFKKLDNIRENKIDSILK
jgi:hypothetical protein